MRNCIFSSSFTKLQKLTFNQNNFQSVCIPEDIHLLMLRFFRLCSNKIAPPLPRISHVNPLWFSSTQQTQAKPSNPADLHSQYTNIFQKIKLEPKLINNTLPNAKLSNCLANLCQRIDTSNCEKRHGN